MVSAGTYLIRLEPGVSAQLSADQNSGSTINVDGRYFSIHWVGP